MRIAGSPGPGLMDLVDASEMEHLWIAESGKQALGTGPAGIGVFRVSSGPQVASWDDVESVSRTLGHVVVVGVQGAADIKFPLAESHSVRDLIESVPAEHRTRLGLQTGALASRRSASTQPAQHGSSPTARHATASPSSTPPMGLQPARPASRTPGQLLWTLLGAGLLLSFVAGIVLAASWPEAAYLLDGEMQEDDANSTGLMVGYLLAGIGACLTTVSLIGFGVRLGVLAARVDEQQA